MKKVILLGVACLLAGCVSLEKTTTELNTKWVGKSGDEFIMEYGAPKSTQKLQNGTTMYTWEKDGLARRYGGQLLVPDQCTVNILVDGNNKIKSIKANGDAGICNEKFGL